MSSQPKTFLLLAAPGVMLGAVGMTHPHRLSPDSAEHWFWMHLVGVFVFPLVGLALYWLVRGRRDVLAIGVLFGVCVYATLYTALDVVSGIGNGYVTWQLGEDADPRPAAVSLAFRIGTKMGDVGAWALFLAAVLIAIDVLRRHGARLGTILPLVVLLAGSFVLREEHIFWFWGSMSCLAIGVGTGWLGVLYRATPEPSTS